MISYVLFLQIQYPKPVVDILKDFLWFSGEDLPNIIPDNKYYMSSPQGFKHYEYSALFLKNSSQYL